jgi:biotin-(acetyl-CoA carboxylase) ligase
MQHLSQTAPEPLEASAALLGAMAQAWQRCAEPQSDAATANFSDVFAQHDALYGREVTAFGADGELQHGIAKGINAQGYLGMQLATGQIVWLHSGEVSVRPKAKLVEGAR